MEVISSSIIYENPLPQLRSRQSMFPSLCELPDGTIAAVTTIGQAFESVDSTSYIAFSNDGGVAWSEPQRMFENIGDVTDYCKISMLPDGKAAVLGYAYVRDDHNLPLGNPDTGGLLDDFVFFSTSDDFGKTWSVPKKIDCVWGPHIEASAPITVLKNGTLITPITGFPDWNGQMHGKMCGRALRSEDGGITWNDNAVCMDFGDNSTTCYEQRMCQLESGAIICIGWNENTKTGKRLENHYTVSYDDGKTWSKPVSTGIMGQASSVCAIGGEKLLALHSVRRDTDRPGIYACIVDFSGKKWDIIEKELVWEPDFAILKDNKMADIFSFLKFGQPSAILLKDGDILMSHWYAKDGLYKTVATRLSL